MPLQPFTDRARAVNALHHLVGGPDQELSGGSGIPVALYLPAANLVLCAGDHQAALDVYSLRPLALKRSCSVIGTYVDQKLSGHRIVVDAVLFKDGQATLHAEYRAWLAGDGRLGTALVPESGTGPTLRLGGTGLRLADKPPYASKAKRMVGIACGQALLHRLIWENTHFLEPLARSLNR